MTDPVCKFCSEIIVPIGAEHMNQLGILVYSCEPCAAEYLYWSGSMSLSAIALYTTFNNKMYRWSQSTSGLNVINISNEKEKLGATFPNQTLKKFKGNIEINPQNISSKIGMMLTFL